MDHVSGAGVCTDLEQHIRTVKGLSGRLTARNIHELQNLKPSEIAETIVNSLDDFKETLETCSMPLLLDVIAKAFTCHSNETLNDVYIAIKDKGFFNSLIKYCMSMINDISNEKANEFKKPIADMITIMEELIVKRPTSIPEFVGIHTMLDMVIKALSGKSNIIDDDLIERFRQFTELRDKRLTHSARVNVGNKYDARDKELDAKGPPNNFREIKVLPQISDMQITGDNFLRANKVKGKYNDLDHYLDVQFRLLREDFIAPLRDGIAEYVRSLTENGKAKKEIQDIRIYNKVRIIAPVCTDSGIGYTLRFDVRRMQVEWESSKRLIYGTLVCLSPDAFQTFYFATVVKREDESIRYGIIQVHFENHVTVKSLYGKTFTMAETSAYFESYRHNLVGLQNIRDGNLPFENYITDGEKDVKPPAYVRRDQDAKIDLRPLVDDEYQIMDEKRLISHCKANRRHTGHAFSEKSKPAKDVSLLQRDTWPSHDLLHLDESQYEAIHTALTREFVITQGPPGTGKTYMGLKIVKALLHNRNLWNKNPVSGANDIRPMLIVCYTNHALDQFLEGIMNCYKGDILRVGGGSKSDILNSVNLKEYRQQFRTARSIPSHIRQARQNSRAQMEALKQKIEEIGIKMKIASTHILHEDFLQQYISRRHYMLLKTQFKRILFGAEIFTEWKTSIIIEWLGLGLSAPLVQRVGEQAVNRHGQRQNYGNAFDDLKHLIHTKSEDDRKMPYDKHDANWQLQRNARRRQRINTQKNLASTEMMTRNEANLITDLWRLSLKNKWRLYRYWIKQYVDDMCRQIEYNENRYEGAVADFKRAGMQEDQYIMRLSTVIGMTTTCAARYQSVLQEINPRIIIVEEAAEVLEAHIVTTLTKGCEHLIMIGDHKQLKPNPTVYTLAKDYNLDVSLFERMVSNGIRCDCLTLQHRMRPEIAELLKHIYPRLKNHIDVHKYEPMKGVAFNMFFINHTYHELDDEDLKSHSNIHEASYIASLCRYLILQGYQPNQITVLTTYSGQLLCLKKLMPKDEFEGVQISVVDNYQGEENDIILLSLVRSNKEGSIGFLKVSNRVCVALSRAKMALYVIGNINLLADKSELWKKIKFDIEQKGQLGDGLALYCQNHPDMGGIIARQASDFSKAPDGGCIKKCEYRLNCGHVCGMHCHILDKEHVKYKCMEDCQSVPCERGHRCPKKCYEDCGKCYVPIEKIIPKCQHKQYIPCHQDPSTFSCSEPCIKQLPCKHQCLSRCGEACTKYCVTYVLKKWPCGHVGKVRCFEAAIILCPEPCDAELKCKHMCAGTCGSCFEGRLHRTCKNACNRILICGHKCKDMCNMCPPCTAICNNMCNHNKCSKLCGEICVKCEKPCEWICKHYKCSRLCSEPCDRPRCNEPCEKCLPCGHACIGLCGEPCPNECRQCDKDKVANILFGEEDGENARFVVLQDCEDGCIVEYKSMDRFMDMRDVDGEIKLKSCPKCNTPIRRNVRYGSLIKKTLQQLEEVKYKIITNRKRLVLLEDNIKLESASLQDATRKCFIAKLEDMPEPKSENTLVALNNQMTIIQTIAALEKKWRNVSEKRKGFDYLHKLRVWTIALGPSMSAQELEDAQLELSRSKDHLKIQNYQLLFRKDRKILGKELDASMKHAKCILTKRGRYTDIHQNVVRACISELKKVSSSIGVTEEENIPIATATAFRKGQWFKCQNGHVYTIGDCYGATEKHKCLECKCSYTLGNDTNATGHMEDERFAAWTKQRKLANYVYNIKL